MKSAFKGEARESLEAESVLWTSLRALAYAMATLVLLLPLANEATIAVGAIGAFLGCVLARPAARSYWRLVTLCCAGMGTLFAGVLLKRVFADGSIVASLLGPTTALWLSDLALFSLGAAGVSFTFRTIALRQRDFVVVEALTIAFAFASYFAPHRDGAINRPFELADPILTRGGDPTIAVLIGGGIAVGVMAMLFLRERRILRTLLHLVLVALLLVAVVITTSMKGLPTPPPPAAGDPGDQQQNGNGGNGGGGSSSNPSQRQTPIAVVLFHNDYSPPSGMYYFRQGAFSQFNGARLVATTRSDVDLDLIPSFPTGTSIVRDPPSDSGYSDDVETSVALLTDHSQPLALASPYETRAMGNANPARFRRIYRVRSRALIADYPALAHMQAGSPSWSPEVRAVYTAPAPDPRYAALAQEILNEVPEHLRTDPIVRTLAITDWLGEHSKYSLRQTHEGAADPTADYLFGNRIGYCVHFSHAAVHLMRAAGLPSRVATGYAVPESSRQGGSALLVSIADAHAWPEVYLDGVGWVIADVSPAESLDPPPPPPDPDLQRLLGELARAETPLPEDGSPPPRSIREITRLFGLFGRITLLGALIALLLYAYVGKFYRRLAPRFATPGEQARVRYRATLDVLSELGHRRKRGESREAFAARMKAVAPSLAPLTLEHLARKFGHGANIERVAREASATTQEASKQAPAWRRVISWLDPFSWMRTR